jgi:cyclohexa-1,5-dienecarbonyl-CoA hydratase
MNTEQESGIAEGYVEVSSENGVAVLQLNRSPDNMLNIAMMEEINSKLLELRSRPDLKVLLIRGNRESFSCGIDVADHTRARVNRTIQVFHRIFETIRMLEVVSIAAVQGKALDGGFELALGCNLIMASDSASFSLPEIHRGAFPPVACIVLPAIGPRRKAMEWILTGDPISAEELRHFGIVNQVYEEDKFDSKLAEFIKRITRSSGPVMQLAKQAQVESYYSSWGEALYRVENLYLRELISLADSQEGMSAILENRKPEWTDS